MAAHKFSIAEYVDIVECYIKEEYNGRAAQRLYNQRWPERHQPHHSSFQNVYQRFRETGSVKPCHKSIGRPTITVDQEEEILETLNQNPMLSSVELANEVGHVSDWTVRRVLRQEGLHAYHFTRVQNLHDGDNILRINYCNWFLAQYNRNRRFPFQILWADESKFGREGPFNQHNHHFYADENPHMVWQRNFQRQFSTNVYCAVINDQLFYYLYEENLTGQTYHRLLEEQLDEFISELPLIVRRNMYYVHDGAPAHNAHEVVEWLNIRFPGKWLGRNGPIRWPPRSPDLTVLDFALWGIIKQDVYKDRDPPENIHELQQRIIDAFERLKNKPQVLKSMHRETIRRCRKCLQVNGDHFEQLLQ